MALHAASPTPPSAILLYDRAAALPLFAGPDGAENRDRAFRHGSGSFA